MFSKIAFISAATLLGLALHFAPAEPAVVGLDTTQPSTKPAAVYTCPMHSDVVSDKPGKCPKCGMDLVLVKPKTP
jgi:hypothetical protein